MSAKTLIERYGKRYTFRRWNAGSYDEATGKWAKGTEVLGPNNEPLTLIGSAQPLSFMENLVLPEGQRERDAQRLYTLTPLRVANQETGTPADVVLLDSGEFVVFKEASFTGVTAQPEPLPHYKYIVQRAMKDKEA